MPATFIDIHVLQTVPPSNLNRDDTGTPKSAVYGGVRRARVSSQAWKRAARRDFAGVIAPQQRALRTKRVLEQIVARIRALDPAMDEATATARATSVLKALGLKLEKARSAQNGEPTLTEYLVFFSSRQLDRLAELAVRAEKPTKREAVEAADQEHGVEVALFGRMVANAPDINVDAAVQVAHAISTHAVETEYDYYTAVDDFAPEDNTGAGMLGTIEFNSATLYRYATVALDQLGDNLGDHEAAVTAAEAFVHSFITSMPTGKQNTFANRTPVDVAVVMVRSTQPVSLVGAFEEAVPSGEGGFVRPSAERLVAHSQDVDASFAGAPEATFVVRVCEATKSADALGERITMDDMSQRLRRALREVG